MCLPPCSMAALICSREGRAASSRTLETGGGRTSAYVKGGTKTVPAARTINAQKVFNESLNSATLQWLPQWQLLQTIVANGEEKTLILTGSTQKYVPKSMCTHQAHLSHIREKTVLFCQALCLMGTTYFDRSDRQKMDCPHPQVFKNT